MSHNRPPVPVIIFIVLAALGTAAYFGWQALQPETSTDLTASGTVEAVQISIASEIAGKVVEVLVDEGDSVSAGDVLLRLDGSLLEAQLNLATAGLYTAKSAAATSEAALASARAQYDLTVLAALAEESALRTVDWKLSKPTDYDQPSWYFDRAEQLAAFEAESALAQAMLQKAQNRLKFYEEKATSGDFLKAEQELAAARAAYLITQDMLANANSTDADLRDAAQTAFDDAKSILEDAQKAYDDNLTTDGAQDVLQSRAELRVAQERAERAADRVRALQTGLNSPKVLAAQKVVEQAEAVAAQSQTAIGQAEANLALIQAQMARLVIVAPADGVLLTRNIEPGEVINPGAVILSIGKLADLTLTVYVPEDRYGEVALGQQVDVTVDSFSAKTFGAVVVHIADQAEFTPRNVQTVEGRKTTVFAIKLRLDDPEGKLKPGMPADVVFK